MPKSKNTTEKEKTLTAILSLCGLSEKETKLYWILINGGVMSGTEIITSSGFKKGNTYALLHQLQKKMLLQTIQRDGVTHFQPEPPQRIFELLEQKAQETLQAKRYFEQVLIELSTLYKQSVDKPIVRYLEGEKGIINIFKEVYHSFRKVVWGCVDPHIMPPELRQNLVLKKLMPLRVKNKVVAMTLFPQDVREPQLIVEKNNLKTVFNIDREKYPMPCQIDAWDDKVSFISFKKGNLVGAVIENEDYSTTIQSLFKLCFHLLFEKLHQPIEEHQQAVEA